MTRTVTAVNVGFDSPTVHAVEGDRSGAELRDDRELDTLCGAARRATSRTGYRPALSRTSASGGITCRACQRSL
jgi:hypothetical protein